MIRVYYWKARANFGDRLTPLLLKRFSKLDSEWADIPDADLIGTGSLLDKIPNQWAGIILGTGKLHEETKVDLPFADILALRGPLSAKGVKGDYAIGDAGLLADELIDMPDKEYELGVVPHWSDTQLAHDPRFTRYSPKIIDVAGDPLEVIREIGSCKKIVSSSLHGVILADAFNIPRRIEIAPWMISRPKQEGGIFKWRDYSASLGMELEIGVTQEVERHVINDRQFELFDAFSEVRDYFDQEDS